MKNKTLSLLCGLLMFLFSNVYSEEKTETINPDEEIKKYEVRGIINMGTPSVSIYYEGKSLGWTKPGQKRGNCVFKAYDKATKEIILEIDGKEYRLREGISDVSVSEEEELKIEVVEIDNKQVLKIYSKDSNRIFIPEELKKIVDKYPETKKIHLYGAKKIYYMSDSEEINTSTKVITLNEHFGFLLNYPSKDNPNQVISIIARE